MLNFDISQFDPEQHKMTGPPPGWYRVAIAVAEQKDTANGEGRGLNLQYRIVDGLHRGAVIFHWITVSHSNPQAQAMGLGDLSRVFVALGIRGVKSESELVGRELWIETAPDRKDPARNRIKSIKSLADHQQSNGATAGETWGAF